MDATEKKIRDEYRQLGQKLTDSGVFGTPQFANLGRRQAELQPIITLYDQRTRLLNDIEALKDPALAAMASEAVDLRTKLSAVEAKLQLALLPSDPNDSKDVIVEIRAGAGGDESTLFAAELYRAYSRYAESKKWKTELLSESPSDVGGYKEIVFGVHGSDVYSQLKFESGVHRVQRVPATESQGRVHTSTVTVAVLPQVEETELEINPGDLRIDVYRSSGHGGQSVNTTDSAVRITHLPTGLVVSMQDEKSQLKNKQKAMSVLRARLLALKQEEEQRASRQARLAQIGTGDRSEKIRTYNFPQDRVTDHRIGRSQHNLPAYMDGHIGAMIEALQTEDLKRKLANVQA